MAPLDTQPVPKGRIGIAGSAIIATVRDAVLSSYGIVELGPGSLRSSITRRLGLGDGSRGIEIIVGERGITIELSVVMEYGTPIFTIASNVMQSVKFQVEAVLGMDVERVNVNVDGLRVSDRSRGAT